MSKLNMCLGYHIYDFMVNGEAEPAVPKTWNSITKHTCHWYIPGSKHNRPRCAVTQDFRAVIHY